MLGMTPLFSWCQWNLQFSQISSQICAIHCSAVQKNQTGLNYVSAWLKASSLDRAPALPAASIPDLNQAAGPVPHILSTNSKYSQPVFKYSAKWGLWFFFLGQVSF